MSSVLETRGVAAKSLGGVGDLLCLLELIYVTVCVCKNVYICVCVYVYLFSTTTNICSSFSCKELVIPSSHWC